MSITTYFSHCLLEMRPSLTRTLVLLGGLSLCFSVIQVQAVPNEASTEWKKVITQTTDRGIYAAKFSSTLVNTYKGYAQNSSAASGYQYRSILRQHKIKLAVFLAAEQSYAEAKQHYIEALTLLSQSVVLFTRANTTASRSFDDNLPRFRPIVAGQLHDATSLYAAAKQRIIDGNRAFNAGIRYYNSGAEEYERRTSEKMARRLKFHRWPADN